MSILAVAIAAAFAAASTAANTTAAPQDPVLVPQGADEHQLVAAAAAVRPSARQVRWQQHGFVAFVHFGMNTFTDREWGEGNEDPAAFAPTDFDAAQWVATFAAAGMRGVILTAKHHDGFCLWPTASTAHSVAQSPFRGGKGDVVAEVAAACKSKGLSFGVYLSPWDRNNKAFGTHAYHEIFQQQLKELCSNYGPLFEVWFDGAHCPADDPAVFDWQAHFRLVRELQPDAAIAITGPDVRWVGNEAGTTRKEEWSVLPLDTDDGGAFEQSRAAWQSLWRLREQNQDRDLGSRAKLRGARRLCWWPAETDVSIRPGWFWHAAEDDKVKPWTTLRDMWFAAAGGNALLLLNVPADRRGRIADPDVAALGDLGRFFDATFATDLARDALKKTYARCSEVYFASEQSFDVLDLKEDIATAGQQIESFRIDTWDGEQWRELQRGTTIGCRRLLRLPVTKARGVRIWVLQGRGKSKLLPIGVHLQPTVATPPVIQKERSGKIAISGAKDAVHYTTDGSLPTKRSPRYDGPFDLPRGGTVRAAVFAAAAAGVFVPSGGAASAAVFGIDKSHWRVLEASSEQAPGEAAAKAIDGDPATHWHSRWSPDSPAPPHHLAIDLGEKVDLTGFGYLPRREGQNGIAAEYELQARGGDGEAWVTVSKGTMPAATDGSAVRIVRLPAKVPAVGQVRFVVTREVQGRAWGSCAELEVFVN